MFINGKELKRLLKEKGKKGVLTMYINWKINLHPSQLEMVLNYGQKSLN